MYNMTLQDTQGNSRYFYYNQPLVETSKPWGGIAEGGEDLEIVGKGFVCS